MCETKNDLFLGQNGFKMHEPTYLMLMQVVGLVAN